LVLIFNAIPLSYFLQTVLISYIIHIFPSDKHSRSLCENIYSTSRSTGDSVKPYVDFNKIFGGILNVLCDRFFIL